MTTRPVPPTVRATATQSQDALRLDLMAAKERPPVPPAARLSLPELYEVDRLAGVGANLYQIGIHLRKPADIWEAIVKLNPAVAEAYMQGLNRLQIEAMEAIHDGAIHGKDASLLRLLADRKLGTDWAPPKQGPAVIVNAPQPVRLDVESSVRTAFANQRRLIEAEAVPVEAGADSDQERSPPQS